jgi:protein TonB
MNILKQPNNNLDELVFENRNKAYGAYVLRSNYDKNLKRSFLITFVTPLLIIVFSIVYNKLHGNEVVIKPTDKDTDSLVIIEVVLEKKKFVEEVEKAMTNQPKVEGNNQNYQVERNQNIRTELSDSIITRAPFDGPEGPAIGDILPTLPLGPSGPKGEEGNNEEFSIGDIEKMPEFNGDLYEYLGNELKYPSAALANNIEGKVMVSFVINKNGEISDIEILKKIGFGFDEEAVRVIKNMPKWSAGEQNNRKVNVKMVLPIVFEVTN